MPIQSSGVIRFSDIQDEFGGSNPIALSEYYRGGDKVGDNNTSVPASGSVSLSDFYGAVNGFTLIYEMIGAGGGGGYGKGNGLNINNNITSPGTGRGATGGFSRIHQSGSFTETANGGLGGRNGQRTPWNNNTHGESTFYGSGGAKAPGESSANGRDAPASSYGAGGGGGYGDSRDYRFGFVIDDAGPAGEGGFAGTRRTGTQLVLPGSSIEIIVGHGGAGGDYGSRDGGDGADGYVKLTIGNQVQEYTSPGTYTYTVPST